MCVCLFVCLSDLFNLNYTEVVFSYHPRDILADTPTRERMSRVSNVTGDFPIQINTRLHDWSASSPLRCIVLPVCPCVVSLSKSTSLTRATSR